MRVASAFVVVGALWAGAAEASSFVVLPGMTEHLGPSMVAVGQTATPDVTVAAAIPEPSHPLIAEPGQVEIISRSVIALGEPAVTSENVAAIGADTKKRGPSTTPMVIRGGVVGDAFSPAATSAPVAADPQTAAQAPRPGMAPPKPTAGTPDYAPPPAPAAPAMKP